MLKKLFMVIVMVLGITMTVNAQVQQYRTTAFAQASVYNGHYVWGDWQDSNMYITLNLNTDVITIYSPQTQIYRVISTGNTYTDGDGGRQVSFKVYDQDGDRGTIRLRIQQDGTSQLYVDFSNVAWCYCVVRIA